MYGPLPSLNDSQFLEVGPGHLCWFIYVKLRDEFDSQWELEVFAFSNIYLDSINLAYEVMWDIQSDEVNISVGVFPILMTLFSAHVNNLRILNREKVTLRRCFAIFLLFLQYHHLSTNTENTVNFSHIFQKVQLSHTIL